MTIIILISLFIGIPVGILWVNGIEYMAKKHPDYKGLDLFDEDEEENS